MFVSYRIEDSFETGKDSYGYMCFTDGYVKVDKLHEYIEDRLFRKCYLQFLSQYSTKMEHWVQTYTDGIYRNIEYKKPLRDVEEIGELYLYLHKKYGFTNILGFT